MKLVLEVPSEYDDVLIHASALQLRDPENLALYNLLVYLDQYKSNPNTDVVREEKV